MFDPFQMVGFAALFWFFFLAVFAFIAFAWIVRFMKSRQIDESTQPENQTVIREKEIIREIVKIRCPYCNNLYDEKLDKCPNCGARHP
jgi:rubrerythrin